MKIQQTIKGSYFVTIPMQLIRLAGWEKGTQVIILPNREGYLEIRKV